MEFQEIKKAIRDLVHAFGCWTFDNESKTMKVKYYRETADYNITISNNGSIIKRILHTDLDRVTQCFMTYLKNE